MQRTIYLVRHCSATGQEPDAALTTEGYQQAVELGEWLSAMEIGRIVSSPFTRAIDSITPLASQLALDVEIDERLMERVLSDSNLPDWRNQLAASFVDLDLRLPGGESSREAMERGVALLDDILKNDVAVTIVVTHGNLLTLLLKHFDESVGFSAWEQLTNPDVFCITANDGEYSVDRITRS